MDRKKLRSWNKLEGKMLLEKLWKFCEEEEEEEKEVLGRWETQKVGSCTPHVVLWWAHAAPKHTDQQGKKHSSSEFTALAACCLIKDLVMLRSRTSAHSPAVSPVHPQHPSSWAALALCACVHSGACSSCTALLGRLTGKWEFFHFDLWRLGLNLFTPGGSSPQWSWGSRGRIGSCQESEPQLGLVASSTTSPPAQRVPMTGTRGGSLRRHFTAETINTKCSVYTVVGSLLKSFW